MRVRGCCKGITDEGSNKHRMYGRNGGIRILKMIKLVNFLEEDVYSTVTDDFIISTISNYQGEVILIEKKIDAIRRSFAEDRSLIYAASIPGVNNVDDTPEEKFERDLQIVYERYQKLSRLRTEDGIAYITELFEKKDSMDRVMAAFKAIPEYWRTVMENLYIKRKGKQPKEAIAETAVELFVSERQVMRLRRNALTSIKDFYESDRSLFELQMMSDGGPDAGLADVRLT